MPTPPSAPKRPFSITRHGDTRVDDYYWLMERSPATIAHLEAENAHYREVIAPLEPLRETLFQEFKGRIKETDMSVPVRRRGWWYFERTEEGLNYPISCRVPAEGSDDNPPEIGLEQLVGEEIIFDENKEAAGHDFLSVGVFALSPDDQWIAVGTDFEGSERHTVTIRSITGQGTLPDLLQDVYYGFAWAADAKYFFYTKVDEAMRPWQVWRHAIGSEQSEDHLVYQEDDAQYSIGIGKSRDEAIIGIQIGSSMTSEFRYIDAAAPLSDPRVVEARNFGVEYDLEHFVDQRGDAWWLKTTNEGATDFRLMARRVQDSVWREIIPERPGSRLEGVDAFATFLAIGERSEGCPALRVVQLQVGDDPFGSDLLERSHLVPAPAYPSSVGTGGNPNYETTHLRVAMASMTTPSLVATFNVDTEEMVILKQQEVLGGYEESDYVTGRWWTTASDGERIPVTLVAHRNQAELLADGSLRPKGPAPLLLYGYGSYEISIDPRFSAMRLSLLDRGVIYAIAHIRGGGEMGRRWYEMGKLAQKPTTFSDFVRVARDLVDSGWTTPALLAARGGSAGGLLMGAVMNLAPELFHAIIAEVPFVDVVTTMLDASLPLTVGEWEEWGNPEASDLSYSTMKSYSPYDNVSATNADGGPRTYPHLYCAGGLNDSRVGFWEPAKWVLKLRDASDQNQAILKTEMGAGHSGPTGRYDAWRDEAEVIAWLLNELAITQ
ncbi:MAG: S9 family peptidase [Actinomycetota bacterium]